MGEFTKRIAGEIKELAGVDAEPLMGIGLINPHEARKWVVKQRYYQMCGNGRTKTDIKGELSATYGISVSSIEKMVYRK